MIYYQSPDIKRVLEIFRLASIADKKVTLAYTNLLGLSSKSLWWSRNLFLR